MKILILVVLSLIPLGAVATRVDVSSDLRDDFIEPLVAEARGCSNQQSLLVRETERNVAQRLDQLLRDWLLVDLAGVKRTFVEPENREWVEGGVRNQSYQTYWRDLGKVLTLMKEKADRGLNFQCQPARDKQCQNGAIAYVMVIFGRPRQMIYLCPAFFEDGSYSTTIFHELSHYAASTEDYALDWWNLEKSDLKKGAKDAYHVESFMKQEVPAFLKKSIWLWWWPKKNVNGFSLLQDQAEIHQHF